MSSPNQMGVDCHFSSKHFSCKNVSFRWVIEDFAIHRLRIKQGMLPEGAPTYVESPPLDSQVLPGVWTCRVFPFFDNDVTSIAISKTKNKYKNNGVGMFLAAKTPVNANVWLKISVIDDNNEEIFSRNTGDSYPIVHGNSLMPLGFEDLIKNEADLEKCLGNNGSIRVLVELKVYLQASSFNATPPYTRLLHDVKLFLESNDYKRSSPNVLEDAFLLTGETKVPCSKFLLYVRCKPLRPVISSMNGQPLEIPAHEFSTTVLENLAKYLVYDTCDLLNFTYPTKELCTTVMQPLTLLKYKSQCEDALNLSKNLSSKLSTSMALSSLAGGSFKDLISKRFSMMMAQKPEGQICEAPRTPVSPEGENSESADASPPSEDLEISDEAAEEPEVTSPQVTSPQVTSPQVTSPQVTSPQVTSPQVTSPQVVVDIKDLEEFIRAAEVFDLPQLRAMATEVLAKALKDKTSEKALECVLGEACIGEYTRPTSSNAQSQVGAQDIENPLIHSLEEAHTSRKESPSACTIYDADCSNADEL